jgi:hypothetical protein
VPDKHSKQNILKPKESLPLDLAQRDFYSGMIFEVTQQQREALLAADAKEFQTAFGDATLKAIRDTYEEEGLVLIRGLFQDDLLQRLCDESQLITEANKSGNTFTSLKFGPIFCFPESDVSKLGITGQSFRDTALTSSIPAFVARVLFCLDDEGASSQSLRLLKDCFMAKGKEQNFCGWHVDDSGFWPTSKESLGANVWIAIDDMQAEFGGSLAVSP